MTPSIAGSSAGSSLFCIHCDTTPALLNPFRFDLVWVEQIKIEHWKNITL